MFGIGEEFVTRTCPKNKTRIKTRKLVLQPGGEPEGVSSGRETVVQTQIGSILLPFFFPISFRIK